MNVSLLLDTSTKYLHIGLIVNSVLVEKVSELADKQQSEITMLRIQELFQKHDLSPNTLQEIVISEGPGSYTGIRIAMTIAKVLGSVAKLKVFTLNTLQIYCGLNQASRLALLDARSSRAYVAVYQSGKLVLEPQIMTIEEIKGMVSYVDEVVGDASLIQLTPNPIDFIQNMYDLKPYWQEVESIDDLVPLYLKKTTHYGHQD